MGEKLVGVVELVAKKMAVDLGKVGAGVAAVEEAEEPPLYLSAASAHVSAHGALGGKFEMNKDTYGLRVY